MYAAAKSAAAMPQGRMLCGIFMRFVIFGYKRMSLHCGFKIRQIHKRDFSKKAKIQPKIAFKQEKKVLDFEKQERILGKLS